MPNLNYLSGRGNERTKRLERAAPLGFSSVSRGSTRFLGLLSLIVEGSALVNGLLTVAGTHLIQGILNVAGPWNLSGTGGITGNVSSTGTWTQTGTYTVNGAGKIVVTGTDPVTLGVTSSGRPGLQFATGSQVVGTSDGAQLTNAAGNGFAFAGDTVGLQRGSKRVAVTAAGIEMSLTVAPAGTTVYMVVADASGNLYRKAVAA